MNEKQKDFTIKEIDKYNGQINDLYYKINRNTMFTFCGVSLAVAVFAINGGEFSGNEIIDNLVGISSIATSAVNGVKAIQSICEKAGLEHTVRVLEHELKIEELKEENPHTR